MVGYDTAVADACCACRHPALDTQLTKDRHRAEVRALAKCKQCGVRVPTMYLADNITTTIVMENITTSITAKDFINNMLEEKNTAQLSKLAVLIGDLHLTTFGLH